MPCFSSHPFHVRPQAAQRGRPLHGLKHAVCRDKLHQLRIRVLVRPPYIKVGHQIGTRGGAHPRLIAFQVVQQNRVRFGDGIVVKGGRNLHQLPVEFLPELVDRSVQGRFDPGALGAADLQVPAVLQHGQKHQHGRQYRNQGYR